MQATDVLEFEADDLGALDRPVMLIALEGWFDVAGAATHAVSAFTTAEHSVTIGSIDPDPFYDFTQQRPHVTVDDDIREIVWPANDFTLLRQPGHRDLIRLVGVEPHLHWKTYIDAINVVAGALGCEAIVTVGAAAEALPHTRTPPVTGSTANAGLASSLGLTTPSYQGVTGLIGALHAALEARHTPSVSLRVGIPHYLMNAEHPQAVAALTRHLSHVLDAPTSVDLGDQIERWRTVHDEVIESDEQLMMYVKMLEAEFDRRAEANIPSADDLGDRFEEFLRSQRDDKE
ncbi:MAG: PAC2 family protein [Ilumatobacteraceae bacterium]|nr:PAC2 family protein [Ilumatobacteraceae bacterium]